MLVRRAAEGDVKACGITGRGGGEGLSEEVFYIFELSSRYLKL